MDLKLKDKVVLITASTGGVGQALVRAFAGEGCKLAITSTSQAKLDAFVPSLEIPAARLKTFVADLCDESQVKNVVDKTVEYFGGLDAAVINQGWEGAYQPIEEADYDNWLKTYTINVFSQVYVLKYVTPHLVAKGKGAIIAIASNGSYTGSPGMAAYCSTKHALAGVMKSVAMELGPKGIHCNFICPGAIETPMIHRIEENTFGGSHKEEQPFAFQYLDKSYCTPEEVACAALYLASEVSAHIMGTGLRMDGGLDAQD